MDAANRGNQDVAHDVDLAASNGSSDLGVLAAAHLSAVDPLLSTGPAKPQAFIHAARSAENYWDDVAAKCDSGMITPERAADVWQSAHGYLSGLRRARDDMSDEAAASLEIGDKQSVEMDADPYGNGQHVRCIVKRGSGRESWDHDRIWRRIEEERHSTADEYDEAIFEHKAAPQWRQTALRRMLGDKLEEYATVHSGDPTVHPEPTPVSRGIADAAYRSAPAPLDAEAAIRSSLVCSDVYERLRSSETNLQQSILNAVSASGEKSIENSEGDRVGTIRAGQSLRSVDHAGIRRELIDMARNNAETYKALLRDACPDKWKKTPIATDSCKSLPGKASVILKRSDGA